MKSLMMGVRPIFTLMLFFSPLQGGTAANQVTKVFHHKGLVDDRIVLYCSQRVVCNSVPHARDVNKAKLKQVEFMMPLCQLATAEAKKAVNTVNMAEIEGCKLSLQQVSKPINGLKLTISYNPEKTGVTHETFTSIKGQHGLVFKICHKKRIALLQQQSNPLRRLASADRTPHIVIDCGHGDHDCGTVSVCGIKEKDVARAVGDKVAQILRDKGFHVFLTRKADEFVALDERTAYANRLACGDLFVSLHANAASNTHASGIETWCAPEGLLQKDVQFDLAKTEEYLIDDFAKSQAQASHTFAQLVHQHMLADVKRVHLGVKDRCVKNSVSQVLLGADMPAALIELGFLSNKQEAQLLNDGAYQSALASGICKGICSYVDAVQRA